MENLSYHRIISITILIRYLIMERSEKSLNSISDLAKELYQGVDAVHLKGFLNGQQRSRKTDASDPKDSKAALRAIKTQTIIDRTKEIFEKRVRERGTPRYIVEAYHAAYPNPEDSIVRDAVSELIEHFGALDLDGHLSKTGRLRDHLGGKVYDVWRWCGPSDASHASRETPEKPRAVRAAIQFFHPSVDGRFVRFSIHYKPYELGSPRWNEKRPNESKGLVVPIGDYLWLIGNEVRSRFPVVIAMQPIDPENPDQLGGIVVRKADTKGQLFTSRVLFRLNPDAKLLSQVNDKIGIIPEDQLEEADRMKLDTFSNKTGFDGKQALILLNA